MKKTSILAIVLFLAGCVGTSSPSHFYQLQMTDARVEPVSSRRLDVGVEEAFVPKYLDRPQIVTMEAGSSELKMSEFYRWAEPLSSSFSRVLADDLSLYLPKSVVKYKTLSSENFTYTITLEINKMDAVLGRKLELDVWWTVYKNVLGSPRQLICQCCGMPLADGDISRETDGFFNEEYCKWCYADGEYMYHDLDDLIEVCVQNMASEEFPAEQARAYLKNTLPKLNYWKRYENLGGAEAFAQYKQTLMDEFNDLHIDGMPKVEKLNALVGKYINLAYRLPNGKTVKFLDDQATYLGNQLECEFGGDRCFGIAANMDFLLVCTYEENGKNPELVVYKKR